MTKQIKETYIHEHEGIKVGVRIDYRQKQISIVDTKTGKLKQYAFQTRGLEYMDEWHNILSAVQVAIAGARLKLKVYLEEENPTMGTGGSTTINPLGSKLDLPIPDLRPLNTERE